MVIPAISRFSFQMRCCDATFFLLKSILVTFISCNTLSSIFREMFVRFLFVFVCFSCTGIVKLGFIVLFNQTVKQK